MFKSYSINDADTYMSNFHLSFLEVRLNGRDLYNTCAFLLFFNSSEFFFFEMKVPKGNEMKKYVIMFCIVLVFIVLSTVLAGFLSTNNISNEVDENIKRLPQWEHVESIPSKFEDMKTVLQLGNIF